MVLVIAVVSVSQLFLTPEMPLQGPLLGHRFGDCHSLSGSSTKTVGWQAETCQNEQKVLPRHDSWEITP